MGRERVQRRPESHTIDWIVPTKLDRACETRCCALHTADLA